MHCASCAVNIERKLKKTPGVSNATVNYATQSAQVDYDPASSNEDTLSQAISDAGYKAIIMSADSVENSIADTVEKAKQRELMELRNKLYISSFLSVLILLGSFSQIFTFTPQFLRQGLTLLFLTIPIQFYIGASFYIGAYKSFKNRAATMDTLIAVGTTAAFLLSVAMTIFPAEMEKYDIMGHYFDVSALVITLILLGKYFEIRARSQTGSAIKKLLGLQAKTARAIINNNEIDIPISSVRVGDILIVRPGDKIPVDGQIIKGTSFIDESMVSGEPIPVEKHINDYVTGGTLNRNGTFEFKATKVGNQTLLAQIIKMVEQAQGSKAPIQKLADTISSFFVPLVLVLSALTFVIWIIFGPQPSLIYAILNAVGVLVIACPCALGLATPTAIMVGTGRGASYGILIKNASILESAHKVTTVVFDKTGTITQGRPEVSSVIMFNDFTEENLLILTASLESRSSHPLAESIVNYAKNKNLKLEQVEEFDYHTGLGVQGKVKGQYIIAGTRLLQNHNINYSEAESLINNLQEEHASTVISIAIDGALAGLISITDPIKTNASSALSQLHLMGIKTIMLTGDNEKTAKSIATAVGIDHFEANLLPQQKERTIQSLMSQGEIVAMVGDGINDAPALALADIGIAMGSGTDIAIESSDITLLRGDLSSLVKALSLSKKTMSTIKQNLFWAFGYNIILIPVAMGVLYPFSGILLSPVLASAAMALSSVSVVMNSLRLNMISIK